MNSLWLLINIYLSLFNGSVCNLGQPVDWYQWSSRYGAIYHISKSFNTAAGDAWLVDIDDDRRWLFVFEKPIDETIGSGADHGKCFRRVK